jgi:hypothetical protein
MRELRPPAVMNPVTSILDFNGARCASRRAILDYAFVTHKIKPAYYDSTIQNPKSRCTKYIMRH